MRRREFISLLGGGAFAWPVATLAQQIEHVRRIGIIMNYAEADGEGQERLSLLRDRLNKLGWTPGKNIQIEVRWTAGQLDRMRAHAAELISIPVDVLVGYGTPLLKALKALTQTIPIVFVQIADPARTGLVSNYARPDGNITGFTDLDASIAGKWMEVLKEAAPFVSRVIVLANPEQPIHREFLREIDIAAPSLKIEISVAERSDRAGIEQTVRALAGRSDFGLIALPGPTNNTLRDSIIQSAARYRLPAIYPYKYYVKDGGLLCYGIDQIDQWHKVAEYVDRILRGEKLSALPVQAPTKFELVINLKTARELGLSIPRTLLDRADEVIE
jgi:putative ABC transport system substrate-binding protein